MTTNASITTPATGDPASARARTSNMALWFGIFGGPLAWSVQTLVNLPVAAHNCFPRLEPLSSPVTAVRGITFAVSVLALVACGVATAVAWRSWTRTRHEQREAAGRGRGHAATNALLETGEGRTRFMALAGVLSGVTFLLVCAVNTATLFLVSPCAF